MSLAILLALAAATLAAVPVLVTRRRLLVNPAFYVFLIVFWSFPLVTGYIALFHAKPLVGVYDKVFVGESSTTFLTIGAWLGLAAVAGYTGGYLLLGRRTLTDRLSRKLTRFVPSVNSCRVAGFFVILSFASFLVYLYLSGANPFQLPFSDKRFVPTEIGAPSRFHYLPYYFFKAALLSGSAAYGTALLLIESRRAPQERRFKWLLCVLFFFALFLCHFASLRLLILLLLVQILLLAYQKSSRRHLALMVVFTVLTLASFFVITFVNRLPPSPPPVVKQERVPPPTPPSEAGKASATAATRQEGRSGRIRSLTRLMGRAVEATFEGKYLMSVAKLAHIGNCFPERRGYLLGESLIGVPSLLVRKESAQSGGESLNRYLAKEVFREPNNNIPPGFAAELYINFGWPGIAIGFLCLGAFHRFLYNNLRAPDTPALVTGCLVAIIPSTTLLLLNSGLFATASRSGLDIIVLLVVCLPSVRFGRETGSIESEG